MSSAVVILEVGVDTNVVRVGARPVYRSPDFEHARTAAHVEARDVGVNHVWIVRRHRGRPDERAQRVLLRIAGGPG